MTKFHNFYQKLKKQLSKFNEIIGTKSYRTHDLIQEIPLRTQLMYTQFSPLSNAAARKIDTSSEIYYTNVAQ